MRIYNIGEKVKHIETKEIGRIVRRLAINSTNIRYLVKWDSGIISNCSFVNLCLINEQDEQNDEK